MIKFLIGFIIGAMFGIVIMSALSLINDDE